eukprot:5945953-Amphidinium_carterae.1
MSQTRVSIWSAMHVKNLIAFSRSIAKTFFTPNEEDNRSTRQRAHLATCGRGVVACLRRAGCSSWEAGLPPPGAEDNKAPSCKTGGAKLGDSCRGSRTALEAWPVQYLWAWRK